MKRLYSLVQLLQRESVSRKDLCLLYSTCVCWILDYATPVFYFAPPAYLSQELSECVQIRALRIICPTGNIDYHCALTMTGLPSTSEDHNAICELTFENIYQDSSNNLNKLIPPIVKRKNNQRQLRTFVGPRFKTNTGMFKNSFLIALCSRCNRFLNYVLSFNLCLFLWVAAVHAWLTTV